MSTEQRRMAARRRLGAELRRLREDAELSGQRLATELGWSQAKVSRIEQARTRAEVADIDELLVLLRPSAVVRKELRRLAEEAAGPSSAWRNSTRVGLSRRQRDFIAFEAAAVSIRHYQPLLVPGPLQTPAYARAVIQMAGAVDVERALEARMARRAIISGESGPGYQVVLLDSVLRWCPVSPDVLAEQLHLLANLGDLPRLDLRVVRLDRQQTTFLSHPVVIYDFGKEASSEALVETTTTDLRVTDSDSVTVLERRYGRLVACALSHDDSVSCVRAWAQTALA